MFATNQAQFLAFVVIFHRQRCIQKPVVVRLLVQLSMLYRVQLEHDTELLNGSPNFVEIQRQGSQNCI